MPEAYHASTTLTDWLARLRANEGAIYVREGGETVALSGLSPERWAHHVARWLQEGRTPVVYAGR